MSRSIRWSLALAVAGMAMAVSVAPVRAQDAKATKVATVEGITEYSLPNGARFLLFPDSSSSSVTINMVVMVGSRHEGYGESGMAHLLEHMCYKGTKLYPNINDVDRALQKHGAPRANASTSLDRTDFYETMPAGDKNLEFGIELSADVLQNCFIHQDALKKEMPVVVNEFSFYENDPFSILDQRIVASAFEWHNYGKSIIGNRADIERVPIENLRAFYKKHYRPDNMVLVIGGKFDADKAIAYMEKYFGVLERPKEKLNKTYTEEPTQDGERTVTLRRTGNVPWVGVAYHIPATAHADTAALEVLGNILSAQPSGRLYKGLVEKKKATAAFGGAGGTTHDPYLLEVFAQVADGVKSEEVRDLLIELLENLGNGKVTEAEVARAKRRSKVDFDQLLAKSDAFTMGLSQWIGAGDWRLVFIERDRVEKVTPDDVVAVAKKYLKPSNRTLGIFVPTKDPDRSAVPEVTNLAQVVGGYKGAPVQAAGEHFDPTPENLEKRTRRFELPTGLKAAILPKKTRGEVVIGEIVLRYGNEQSLLGKSTASSLIGPLMMRGTSKHTFEQIQDELDVLGANVTIGGSSGTLTVSLESKRDKLAATLALVREMLRDPTFPEEDLGIIKRATRQSFETKLTDPAALARNALDRKLNPFPKTSIHYVPTIPESIQMLDHVTRADVVQIYKEQLGGAVGEVAFVGDFDEAATMKQVEAMFKDWKAKTPYERIASVVKLDVPGGKERIATPDKANAIYYAGYKLAMDDNDPDYPALILANYLLGQSQFTSRIMERLRQEEGLTYSAGSRFYASSKDKAGGWYANAICNPENIDRVATLFREVFGKFAKDGVADKKELDLAINGLLEERKVDRADDSNVLSSLANQAYLGRTFQRSLEFDQRLAAMSLEEINRAVRRHFQPQRFFVIEAGDFAAKK